MSTYKATEKVTGHSSLIFFLCAYILTISSSISAFSILKLKNQVSISWLPGIAQKSFLMQNLPMDIHFNQKCVNMYFAALLPELLSKNPV
jgi:hypothetical protein